MKTRIIIAAICGTIAISANAQNDSTTVTNEQLPALTTHTTKWEGTSPDSLTEKKKWDISFLGFSFTDDDLKWAADSAASIEEKGKHNKWTFRGYAVPSERHFTFNSARYAYPDGYLGYTSFAGSNTPAYRGFEVGLNILQFSNWQYDKKWFWSTAIGISGNLMYGEDKHNILHKDEDGRIVNTPFTHGHTPNGYMGSEEEPVKYSRPKLSMITLRVPFSVVRKLGKTNRFKLALGAEFEYHGIQSRGKIDMKHMLILGQNKDLGISPFGCNALINFSGRSNYFYARLQLNQMFDKKITDFRAMPFSMGWGFCL